MKKQERLSLLMDGECVEGQGMDNALCDQWLSDQGLQRQWQRYHLIRDTLQGNLYRDLPVDFATRVAQALQSEEQPLYHPVASPSRVATVRTTWQRWWSAWADSMNQLGEISLATGVALLLLYGAHWYQSASTTANYHNSLLNPLPLGGETLPVGYSLSSQQPARRRQPPNDKVNKVNSDKRRLQHSEDNLPLQGSNRVNPIERKWRETAVVYPSDCCPSCREVRSGREITGVGEIPLAGVRRVVQPVIFNAP